MILSSANLVGLPPSAVAFIQRLPQQASPAMASAISDFTAALRNFGSPTPENVDWLTRSILAKRLGPVTDPARLTEAELEFYARALAVDRLVDEAKQTYEDASEHFRLAMRIVRDHLRRLAEVLARL